MNNFKKTLEILKSQPRMETMLSEMFVHGTFDDKKFVIAFRKDIFIFSEDERYSILPTVLEKLSIFNSSIDLRLFDYSSDTIFDVFEDIKSIFKDVLCGQIINNYLVIYDYEHHDMYLSELGKRVFRQLKLEGFVIEEMFSDDYKMITKEEMNSFPDVGYHGTKLKYLMSILRFGLQQGKSVKNWEFMEEKDLSGLIFFSTKSISPLFHATRNLDTTDIPIIIEFEIPNKNLIIQDYDVEMMSGVYIKYSEPKVKVKKSISNKPLSLSKELGLFAYKGWVLPKFINAVWTPIVRKTVYEKQDFVRLPPKEALQKFNLDRKE